MSPVYPVERQRLGAKAKLLSARFSTAGGKDHRDDVESRGRRRTSARGDISV